MALVGEEENVISGRWESKDWVGAWHPEGSARLENNLGLLDKTIQGAMVNCYLHWIDPKIAFLFPYFSWEVKYYQRFHICCSIFFINKTSEYK